MSPTRGSKLANIKLHPFVIVMGAMAIASGGWQVWTLHPSPGPAALLRSCGMGVFAVGVLILVFAYGAMARARTTINPRRHTRAIVARGIYRFSRNPIYLGWFLLLLGSGIMNASPFQVLIACVMVLLLHWAVVRREEEYLARTFGDEYLRYKHSVRRWI